jgi:hypothetical protein
MDLAVAEAVAVVEHSVMISVKEVLEVVEVVMVQEF